MEGPVAEVLVSDIGNVIIDRINNHHEPSFLIGDHRKAPAIPGAIRGLAMLRSRFHDRRFTLSRTRYDFRRKTQDWFVANHFYRDTGIRLDQAFFCEEKSEKVKDYVQLKATHVIEDRAENVRHILDSIRDGQPLHPDLQIYYFRRNGDHEVLAYEDDFLSRVHYVSTWLAMVNLMLRETCEPSLLL